MERIIAAIILLSFSSNLAKGQKSSLLWREDGRCGEQFPLPNGQPGQCDPAGDGPRKGPCCSPKGFCGNTVKHCDCSSCVDYSWENFASEPKNAKPKTKENKTKPKLEKQTKEKDRKTITEDEIVQTRSGSIQGKIVETEGFPHYQFLGIPYAQPPVGSLRFLPPVPVRPWTKTLLAQDNGPQCYQHNDLLPTISTTAYSEDCLHLNIYTQDMNHTDKAVMVWIHGGGFILGSGNDYAPLPGLLKEGVIVVTINYRLASLGFLTFGNDIVSGNMGLKDQALAIQWVKKNIQNFGGNPNKITIFGESAGGVSVHAQVLSPWNFGQIKGAIAQSGTMLLYNQIKSYGEREETFAKHAAEELGCEKSLNQRTLDCLQNTDIRKIMKMLKNNETDVLNKKLVYEWRPVVDNYASNPFLPLDPLEAMQTGVYNQIPFMSGTVKNDGAIILPLFKISGKTTEEIKESWELSGPALMYSSPNYKATQEDAVFANITMKYYNHPQGDSAVEQDQPVMDILSDSVFISPDQKTVEMMGKHSQHVFNYYLTMKTDKSFLGQVLQLGPEYSPIHGDDLMFLFQLYGQKLKLSEKEAALSKQMIKYWTNFAKFGHPTPSLTEDLPYWDAVTEESQNYIELSEDTHMEKNLVAERMYYWDKMMWAPKQEEIERKVIYTKATQFLLGKYY